VIVTATLALGIKKQLPLHKAERELFKLDHLGVGALLAEKWGLSPHCARAMGGHHLPDDPDSDSPLPDCVHAANIIAKTVGLGVSGNPRTKTALPESVARRLGGTLTELTGSLGEIPAEMHKVQLFLNAWNATPADSA
ncbi:MAG: HDOD domain-containing protein, partial [Magnetococcales bacterium]|nr:HDOD domain-containing protein [Magnetococcales bacterium]